MAAFLKDFTEELQLDPRLEDVDVSCSLPELSPVLVMADREKLGRVFMNVIDNSLKYLNQPEKRVRLTLSHDNENVMIAIEDNGSGIEQGALPFIFDRFYRADPSRNTAKGGSGLGLAIVKQIIEGHGGSVTAVSQIGAGTSICMTIPRRKGKG